MSKEELPGRWLSPTETRIWDVLGAGGPLYGKQIARRIGVVYGAVLKIILENLVEREVLRHKRGQGYSRASLP